MGRPQEVNHTGACGLRRSMSAAGQQGCHPRSDAPDWDLEMDGVETLVNRKAAAWPRRV